MGGHSRSIPPPAFDNATELPTSHLSREILRHLPTFDNLDAAEVDELLAYTTAWVLPRGHVLFERGQVGSSCYLIVRGAVRVALSQRGWSETLAILGPGRLFGHMALIDGAPRSATCVVRESAIILELTREVFDAWCSRRSPLAFKLLEMISCSLVDGLRQSGGLLARFAVEGRMTQQRVQNITLPAELLPILPSPDG